MLFYGIYSVFVEHVDLISFRRNTYDTKTNSTLQKTCSRWHCFQLAAISCRQWIQSIALNLRQKAAQLKKALLYYAASHRVTRHETFVASRARHSSAIDETQFTAPGWFTFSVRDQCLHTTESDAVELRAHTTRNCSCGALSRRLRALVKLASF